MFEVDDIEIVFNEEKYKDEYEEKIFMYNDEKDFEFFDINGVQLA